MANLTAFIARCMEPLPEAVRLSMTPHEQAQWHIAELLRLITEDGGKQVLIFIHAEYATSKDVASMGITSGRRVDVGGLCRRKGGVANG